MQKITGGVGLRRWPSCVCARWVLDRREKRKNKTTAVWGQPLLMIGRESGINYFLTAGEEEEAGSLFYFSGAFSFLPPPPPSTDPHSSPHGVLNYFLPPTPDLPKLPSSSPSQSSGVYQGTRP